MKSRILAICALALIFGCISQYETDEKAILIDVLATEQPEVEWNNYKLRFAPCENCSEEYITVNGNMIMQSALIFLHKGKDKYVFNCNYEYGLDVRIWAVGEYYVTVCRKADLWIWGFFRWEGVRGSRGYGGYTCPHQGKCRKPFTNGVDCCEFTRPDCPEVANILLMLKETGMRTG